MKREEIIRAWKDEEYRSTLSETESAALPEHPSGVIDLTDAEMGRAAGREEGFTVLRFCQSFGGDLATCDIGGFSFGCCKGEEF